jgi:hypothetical protein
VTAPFRRRGLLLTLWLWGLVLVSIALTLMAVGLKLSGSLRDYPTMMLVTGTLTSLCVIVAALAALRFNKLGVFGLYFLFGMNFVRTLITTESGVAWRAGVQIAAAAGFGLLVWRVWGEFR